jgi:hypothetical protein
MFRRNKERYSYPCNRPWKPIGLWDVEVPIFSRKSAHRWPWGCQPYAPAALNPQGRFLVVISLKSWVDPKATVRMKELGELKKYIYTSPGLGPATFRVVALLLFILLFGLWGYWHCGHSWPIVPASDDSGEADGMYIGRGNRSSRRKPVPAPLLSITKSHMTRPGFEPWPPRWDRLVA